jgi:hypothetical protein
MVYCQYLWHRTVGDFKQRIYCVYFFYGKAEKQPMAKQAEEKGKL